MEARNRPLPDWMARIRTHQIELPRFQRHQAWGHREITDLLNAVFRGLPIGSVLILEIGDEMPFISRALAGAPSQGERVTELLLDGQQRLTALWRALNEDYEDRTYFASMPEDNEGEIEIISVSRWHRNGKRYPVWADDPPQCRGRGMIPIRLLNPDLDLDKQIDAWVGAAVGDDLGADKALSRKIAKLRQPFIVFNIPFLSLGVGTPKDVALEVFIKMNTSMVRLTTFDIIVAQTEEATGQSLHDLVEGLASTVEGLSEYARPEDIVLAAMALLQDRNPNQSGYLGLDLEKMMDSWPLFVGSAIRTVSFLEEEKVFDRATLPTDSVISPLIALWSIVGNDPDEEGNAGILLRKYMWRAFFTDRYERNVTAHTLQDYRALRNILSGVKMDTEVPIFNEQEHPLPEREAILQANWPRRRDRLARSILLISLRGGAADIADGTNISRASLKKREYHHIYPIAFLKDQGLDEALADRALNCALISWRTNRKVAAKDPLRYLKERAEASDLGDAEIKRRLASHSLGYTLLEKRDYEHFLASRAAVVVNAMRDLAEGIPWNPVT